MSNIEITNYDISGIVLRDDVYEDGLLYSLLATTLLAGTILGRITASGYLTAFNAAATDGSAVPIAVLTNDTELLAATPKSFRALISGQVRLSKLIVLSTGLPPLQGVIDALRDYTIIVLPTIQLNKFDNQ